ADRTSRFLPNRITGPIQATSDVVHFLAGVGAVVSGVSALGGRRMAGILERVLVAGVERLLVHRRLVIEVHRVDMMRLGLLAERAGLAAVTAADLLLVLLRSVEPVGLLAERAS